jgi:hypothetical protein
MGNYQINRNKTPLTPDDVQKGQNFDQFMQAYKAGVKPWYKTNTFYTSAAVLGIVAVVTTVVVVNTSNPTENAQNPFVNAPFANLDVKDTAYTVDAANGGEFLYGTGSLIRVPEGAFLDSAGNLVTGNIQLHYREFHDPASIFLAGIPMTYDSAGVQYHFESAGMFEITATLNGKPLKANPAQAIRIAMASNTSEDKFNVYYLDTAKRNWTFIARDKAVNVAMEMDSSALKDTAVAAIASTALLAPVKPLRADKARPSFAISFDPAEFPELNLYKGVRFEVDEKKTPYDRNDRKVEWEDAQILRNKDGQSYTVTFTKGENVRPYQTYIVFGDADYGQATKTYDQRYKEYEAALKQKQAKEEKKHDGFFARLMNADARRIFVNDSVLRRALSMRRLGGESEQENMVMREFVVKDFGIWNSDCPSSLPQGAEMFVKLLDSRTGKEMELSHIYLVEKNKNAIFTYYASSLANFKFNPDSDNLLWAITSDGKLAVVGEEDFKKIDPKKKEVKLTMQVLTTSVANQAEVQAALGI